MEQKTGLSMEQIWTAVANDHQLPPREDFTTWLILGGRGAGKTRAGAEWIRASVASSGDGEPANDNRFTHKARAIALVAETYADAREVMIEGPSGIRAVTPEHLRPSYEASRRRLVWENGAVAYAFSAEDPDGLRGYQFDTAWSDGPIRRSRRAATFGAMHQIGRKATG